MTAYLFYSPRFRPLSISGEILPGATLTFYESGTTTPTDVYSDAGLTTPLTNPVEANSAGEFPAIYLDPTVTYRALLHDEDETLLWDIDPLAPARDYPPGTVLMFYGTEEALEAAYPPALWQQLDGNNGAPDIRDRVPMGVSSSLNPGDTGGGSGTVNTSEAGAHDHGGNVGAHALTLSQMPAHHHGLRGDTSGVDTASHGLGSSVGRTVAGRSAAVSNSYIENSGALSEQLVEDVGGGETHTHAITATGNHTHQVVIAPPYCALWFVMRRAV